MTFSELLQELRFRNRAVVRRDMRFEHRPRPCFYAEDVDSWTTLWNKAHYLYLYRMVDGALQAPPSGMRSAVPLGGLGTGTVELRADGVLRDWLIFNNSPAGGGEKVQLEHSFFGVAVQEAGAPACTRVLQTHPVGYLPAVEQIEYAGAYPAARLRFSDAELPLELQLFAFSPFELGSPEASSCPAITFSFLLRNPGAADLSASLLFHLPNHTGGRYRFDAAGRTMCLERSGAGPLAGTVAIRADGTLDGLSATPADTPLYAWNQFATWQDLDHARAASETTTPLDDALQRSLSGAAAPRYAALAAHTQVPAGSETEVSFVLAWHLPERPHADERLTNHYAPRFRDAPDVAARAARGRQSALQSILQWQRLCFDNSLPAWLQDAMVNSLGTMAKTGMWLADGRWRQWESFSCPNLDPVHIQFYRVLPYAWFFPQLKRNQMRAFAAAQQPDGYIREKMGHRSTPLDHPRGRMMGDGNTCFVLELYQDHLWSGDRAFLAELWPAARRALQWQLRRAERYGLPARLNNSYDWFFFADKDLASYNAFLHLAALEAGRRLAAAAGDATFVDVCDCGLAAGREALYRYLWTGEHFRAYWMEAGEQRDALHADALYGQLWAQILDLGDLAEPDDLRSHLRRERELNASPYGLKVMQGTDCDDDRYPEVKRGFTLYTDGPVNNLVWQAGSIDWCALNLYLGGGVAQSLAEARTVIQHWREGLNDQWDIRDLTTGWDGHPWCNSHYARQLMLWSIPLALSGQRYSAPDGRLSFAPVAPDMRIPFCTPTAYGVLDTRTGAPRLEVFGGALRVERPVTLRHEGGQMAVEVVSA